MSQIEGVTATLSQREVHFPDLPPDRQKVIILQRPAARDIASYKDMVTKLVRKGWLIVTDVDDHPDLVSAVMGRSTNDAMWRAMRLSHAVQTSTVRLGKAITDHNPEVAIFPNSAFRISTAPAFDRIEGCLRIFYGALNRERFSQEIGRAIAGSLSKSRSVQFVVIHDRAFFDSIGSADKIFYPALPYEAYLDVMQSCHVALMPLEGTNGEEFKSDIKFVEASSLGLASLASPTVYADTIEDRRTGIIVPSIDAWPAALDRVISDAPLRNQVAQTAYRYIRDQRMFGQQVDARLTWYRSLWERRHASTASLASRLASLTN